MLEFLHKRASVQTASSDKAILFCQLHSGNCDMAIFTSVIVGIVVAWLASLLMETDGREDFRRNVIAGIVGAFVGSWILGAFSEPVSAGKFSFGLLFASMCGSAFVLYAISRLTRA